MIVLNGKLINSETINLDKGFLYGHGVFETILIKGHQPVFLEAHLERLNKGLKTLSIHSSIEADQAISEMRKLQCENCAVRISVSDQNIIYSKREIPYKKEDYEKGFSLKVSEVLRNPKSHATYIKSFNYIDNGLERQAALDEGFNEVLFLNGDGAVTEGSTTNLFFIQDGTMYTPTVACGLLPGVMRKWVIDHYKVIEGEYALQQVLKSEGVYLTNSLMGIMKVSRIGGTQIKEHESIVHLQKDYAHFLEVTFNG